MGGYRYFNTFGVTPSYKFGYGNSYTNFNYSGLELDRASFDKEMKVKVKVKVTNTGKLAGKEVVQLYVSDPVNLVDKPESELRAFAKTKELKPGEFEELSFSLKAKDLASFVDGKSAWIAEKGTYIVKIGASSENIKLKKSFTVYTDITAEEVQDAFDLDVEMESLKN